jgi:membrane dipeptidase
MLSMDPRTWAEQLGISQAAVELYQASDVIDLHLDTFIWQRLFGYDLRKRHGLGPLGGRFLGQCDLPRVREAQISGAAWIITTFPFRTRKGRRDAALRNLRRLEERLVGGGSDVAVVRTAAEYRAARALGKHAAWLGIQGGNALELTLADFDRPEVQKLSLVTLLHFTRSRIGAPALPAHMQRGDRHLTTFGRDYVRKLNEKRILVDLAHLSEAGFWDVVDMHDKALPLSVTHAGCQGVHAHFRNLSDAQLKAVAASGGVVGIVFNSLFLGPSVWNGKAEWVVEHIAHALRVIGADHVALGSDFDGAIVPPPDLPSVLALPRLVELMLRRGIPELDVQKVLGASHLRMLELLHR